MFEHRNGHLLTLVGMSEMGSGFREMARVGARPLSLLWATLAISVGVACGIQSSPGSGGATSAAPAVAVSVDRDRYLSGDSIEVTLTLSNASDSTIALRFSSAQRYDFLLRDSAGVEIWRWSDERGFAQMLGTEALDPGVPWSFSHTLSSPMIPGHYTISGVITAIGVELRSDAPLEVR